MRFPPFSLTAKGIHVDVNQSPLFEPVDLDIRNGQALIIKGENGVGKTTLLRVLAGLLGSSGGEINTSKQGLSGHYLGHSNGLKSSQTVRENLKFWTYFGGAEKQDVAQSIANAARELDIEHLLDLPTRVLSAGQKRRAAFAKLLCDPRPLWILDEPSAALDTNSDKLVQNLCISHIEKGGAVIAATHLPFLNSAIYAYSTTLHIQSYLTARSL